MTNAFQDGVWILDTADTDKCLHVGEQPVRVSKLYWQPSAADDDLVIKDGDNEIKVIKRAIAASPAGDITMDFSARPLWLKGFKLHTLDGGTLYVYLA